MGGEAIAVRESLGAYFERTAVPVLVVEGCGRLVTANDAALAQYGFSLGELTSMRVHDLMAAPRPETDDELRRVLRGDPTPLVRRAHRRKDGKVVWAAPRASVIAVGGAPLVVSSVYDVTALVEAERDVEGLRAQLVDSDRLAALGRLTAGVAHEINNPAAFVTLALSLARDLVDRGRSAEAKSLLEEAAAAMSQIREVMNDLRGVSRDAPRSVVDLGSVAAGAIRIAALEAERRVAIARCLEPGVLAHGRGPRLAQVVLNLLSNATQAATACPGRDPRVEVVVRSSGDRAILEVSDSGPGVPDDVGPRVFEPFYTTRSREGGTGLGLWLSRTIVEQEGGTLSWRNRPEGGAVFTVDLAAGCAESAA